MNKKETRIFFLLMGLGLAAVWLNILVFRDSEPWIWILLGVAGASLIGIITVLTKSARRNRAVPRTEDGTSSPSIGKD